MIKKFILSIGLLFSLANFAQEGTASPYSFYGIGDIKFKGTVENRSMGGIGIFPDSIHINLQNPASLSSLKLTTFAVAGTFATTQFNTNTANEQATRSTIDYIAVGIPMGKFGATFGLMPYSAVGYKILSLSETEATRQYTGTGGVNKAFLGFGYQLNKNFSVGLDFNYNFGEVETNSLVFQGNNNVQLGSRELNNSDLSGVTFNTGLMWNSKLNKKLDVYGSFTFAPESNLKSTNSRNIATIQLAQDGRELVQDDVDVNVANTTIKLPTKISFGAGIGKTKYWLIGSEITMQQTNTFGNRFNDIDNVKYENATKYAVGGYYIPKYNSFSSYLQRITYRGGFRFENTGLIIQDKPIDDMAITLGVGLPVGGRMSNINLGVEFGKRGTKAADLVEEKYINLTISLSLNDKWFVKSKYN